MSRPVVSAVSLLALAISFLLSESLAQTPEASFTLYGPHRFERSGGSGSTTITDVLSLPESIGSPYTLYITNGESKDRRRVSGAEISLNGTVVVQSNELTSSVGSLKRTVQLLGQDRLQVRLTGSSHSFITIRVTGTDATPPRLTISSPADQLITSRSKIVVSGHVEDATAVRVTVNGTNVYVKYKGMFRTYLQLSQGQNTITIVAKDAAGNTTTATRIVYRDNTAPALTVSEPASGFVTKSSSVGVRGTAVDPPNGSPISKVTVTVDGKTIPVDGSGAFSGTVTLREGKNKIYIVATDAAGNYNRVKRYIIWDTTPPKLIVCTPADKMTTCDSSVTVYGNVTDKTVVTLTLSLNGGPAVSIPLRCMGLFKQKVFLAQGTNTLKLTATDAAGNSTSVTRTVTRRITSLRLIVSSPTDDSLTTASSVQVQGTVGGVSPVTVRVNGTTVSIATDGSFSTSVLLVEGSNVVTVTATDGANNTYTIQRLVIRDTTPPTLAITEPVEGFVTKESTVEISGTVEDSTSVTVTVNGVPAIVAGNGEFTSTVTFAEGVDTTITVTVVATDAVGKTSTATRKIRKDSTAPSLTITQPLQGFVTAIDSIFVTGVVTDPPVQATLTVTLDEKQVTVNQDGYFNGYVQLIDQGTVTFTVVATDMVGNSTTVTRSGIHDSYPPVISDLFPADDNMVTTDSTITVSALVVDSTNFTVTVNGAAATITPQGRAEVKMTLTEGVNIINIIATDGAGNSTMVTRMVTMDATPPTLTLTQPANGIYTAADAIVVSGTASDPKPGGGAPGQATVTINGIEVTVGSDGTFSGLAALPTQGTDTITVVASDSIGNKTTEKRSVVRDSYPPAITVSEPTSGLITKDTVIAVAVSVSDSSSVTVRVNSVLLARNAARVFEGQVPLVEGTNTLTIVATDTVGNTSTVTRTLRRDTSPPVIVVSQPTTGLITKDTVLTATVTVSDSTAITATANGRPLVQDASGKFSGSVPLVEGANTILIAATDAVGNSTSVSRQVIRDTAPPTLTVTQPSDTLLTKNPLVTVSGTVSDLTRVFVTVNGTTVLVDAVGAFTGQVTLTEGWNALSVVATDTVGNTSTRKFSLVLDTHPPVLTISQPPGTVTTKEATYAILGNVRDSTAVTVTVNGVRVNPGSNGEITYDAPLVEGTNTITILATDAVGNSSTLTRQIKRDTTPPTLTLSVPVAGTITTANMATVTGTVFDSTTVTVTASGTSLPVGADGSFTGQVLVVEGTNVITVVATDVVGNASSISRTVIRDTAPPVLAMTAPIDNVFTREVTVTVTGSVSDSTSITLLVNGHRVTPDQSGSFTHQVTLAEGSNSIAVVATDAAGNSVTLSRSVFRDTTPPVLTLDSPTNGTITNQSFVTASGTVTDATTATVAANGVSLPVAGEAFSGLVPLVEGSNVITVVATDSLGNSTTVTRSIVRDSSPPIITVAQPAVGVITKDLVITVSVTVTDSTETSVTANGTPLILISAGTYGGKVSLVEGQNTITFTATDTVGNSTSETRLVIRDTSPPVVTVSQPLAGLITKDAVTAVMVSVVDSTRTTVTANNSPLIRDISGTFSGQVSLIEGLNIITIVATDTVGNSTTVTRTVRRDAVPPILTVLSPANGQVTADSTVIVKGTVFDSTAVTLALNSVTVAVGGDGSFNALTALAPGDNTLTVSAVDAAGNVSTISLTVTRQMVIIPPDPFSVAPSLSSTVIAVRMYEAVRFLFANKPPIQTGVDTTKLTPDCIGVLRGSVTTLNGEALPGVTITVVGYPEFGQTVSRGDGMFDMVVNGASSYSLSYNKDGYFSAARAVQVGCNLFAYAETVALIQPDNRVTTISFTQPFEAAKSSVVQDRDGARQVTLAFQQGTQAEMVLQDGSVVPLPQINVRATEYTVGPNGPNAMPLPLPPTSGYTYCANLTADEALAANATQVRFSKPVMFYVDNFIGFPVGTRIPCGYEVIWENNIPVFKWVPLDDGRVIQIVSIVNGCARIAVDSAGFVSDSTRLAAFGINDAERCYLATLYGPGQSIMRTSVSYFGMYDLNCGVIAPDGAQKPLEPAPEPLAFEQKYPSAAPSGSVRSVGSVLNQKIERDVPITGAPFTMHYTSEWQSGRKPELYIDVSSDTLPPEVKRIVVEVNTAGRITRDTLPAAPNQTYHYVWDGKDAYGRAATGEHKANIKIGYVYNGCYQVHSETRRNFAQTSGKRLPQIRSRQEITLSQTMDADVGSIDQRGMGNGGWMPSNINAMSPQTGTVYFGNGQKANLSNVARAVVLLARPYYYAFEGGSYIYFEKAVVTKNGTIYLSVIQWFYSWSQRLIARINPDLSFNSFVEGWWYKAPYTNLVLDGNDNLYYTNGTKIFKYAPDGVKTVVAGSDTATYTGDGQLAVNTRLDIRGNSIEVTKSGEIYFAEENTYWITPNHRVRKVCLDGRLTTVAGSNPVNWWDPMPTFYDGMPATQYRFEDCDRIVSGPDGSVYVAASTGFRKPVGPHGALLEVYRIGTDGRLYHVAGRRQNGPLGIDPIPDGTPAKQADLCFNSWLGLEMSPDGFLYINSYAQGKIYVLESDGTLRAVFGCPWPQGSQLGGPLTTNFGGGYISQFSFGRDGTMYMTLGKDIYKIAPAFLRKAISGVYEVPSNDGSLVYLFDLNGRQTKTLNAFTRRMIFSFDYDSTGRLASIMDRDSLKTRFTRDARGMLTAVFSPKGEQTRFQIDSTGMLYSAMNPEGETFSFAYDEGGLLNRSTSPNGSSQTMQYDSLGCLISSATAETPASSLSRTLIRDGYKMQMTSPSGMQSAVTVKQTPESGFQQLIASDPYGRKTYYSASPNDYDTLRAADGTLKVQRRAYDPRFGLQVPISDSTIIITPGGLKSLQHQTRTVTQMVGSEVRGMTDKTNINGREWATTWDGNARVQTQMSPEGRKNLKYLNTKDQVVKDSIPGLAATYYEYDADGRVITMRQAGRITRYSYDSKGRLLSTTDPIGRKDSTFYDDAGRVLRQVFPDGSGVRYAYDANGNMLGLTPPGKPTHVFAYDRDNRPTIYVPPILGGDTTATKYLYDSEGRLQRTVFADSSSINVAYDPVDGKQKAVTFDRGTIGFVYDQTTGNLKQIVGVRGDTLVYAYDGSLLLTEEWRGEVKGKVAVRYDNSFRVIHENVNGADSIALQYDRDDLPVRVGALALRRNTQNGIVLNDTLQTIISDYSYNSAGELTGVTVKRSGVAFYSVSYTRDSLGRITTRKDSIQGITQRFSYGYDLAGRLREVKRNDTTQAIYAYDSNGNRLARTTPAGVDSGAYDAQDRLLRYGQSGYGYSASGYLKYKVSGADSTSFSYDTYGNLVSVRHSDGTWVEYLIDAANRRVGKKVNGATTQRLLYSGDLKPVAELDSSGSVVTRYVFATHENVPEYMVRGGVVYRFVLDHLGSVRLVVNSQTGEIAQRLDYDEFGNVLFDSNPGLTPFGFAGGLYDSQIQLVRFGARDYEARVGRWTLKDPIEFRGNSPNLFAYVRSEPINQVDPNGLVNWTKVQVAVLNWYKGNLQLYRGMIRVEAGLATKSPSEVVFGGKDMVFGASSLRRSIKQFGEAMTEPASNASNCNYLGLLPFGDYYDDPQEIDDIYNKNVNNINTLEEIWRFLSDPIQMFLR